MQCVQILYALEYLLENKKDDRSTLQLEGGGLNNLSLVEIKSAHSSNFMIWDQIRLCYYILNQVHQQSTFHLASVKYGNFGLFLSISIIKTKHPVFNSDVFASISSTLLIVCGFI